jgi:hypothetical protein
MIKGVPYRVQGPLQADQLGRAVMVATWLASASPTQFAEADSVSLAKSMVSMSEPSAPGILFLLFAKTGCTRTVVGITNPTIAPTVEQFILGRSA